MKQKIILTLVACFCLMACDSSFRIEKRRYMKGFYVETKQNKKSNTPIQAIETTTTETAEIKAEIDSTSTSLLTTDLIAIDNKLQSKKEYKQPLYLPVTKKTKEIQKSNTKIYTHKNKLTKENEKSETSGIWFLVSLAGLMGYSFWWLSKNRSAFIYSQRKWAFKNKLKSRSTAVILKTITTISSLWLGVKLFELNITIPSYATPTLFTILAGGLIIDKFRKKSAKDMLNFFRNKFSGILLSIIGVLLCINLGNQAANENTQHINGNKIINRFTSHFLESKKKDTIELSSTQLSTAKKDPDAGTIALKVFLAILTIALAVVLQALTLAWSCALSCSGAETESVLVLIFGTVVVAAIATLCFYWIMQIDLSEKKTQV